MTQGQEAIQHLKALCHVPPELWLVVVGRDHFLNESGVKVAPKQHDKNVEFLLGGNDIAALDDPLKILKVLRRDLPLKGDEHLIGQLSWHERL